MVSPRRVLLGGLVALLAVLILAALLGTVLIAPRFGVDLEIPLRAATRWLAGEPPYLASAFTSPPGATQPFLYPPYTLPFFAVLTAIPRAVADVAAVGLMLVASIVACRRLAIPWIWLPLVLLWPPFAEGIFGANVQMVLFAAFVFLFYRAADEPWRPRDRDVADPAESGVMIGALSTLVGAIKVSQPQPWLYVLHHRPRAAIAGAIGVLAVVALTLPLTGIGLWFDWVAHLRLASDPTWDLGGFALRAALPVGRVAGDRRRLPGRGLVRPAAQHRCLGRPAVGPRGVVTPCLRAGLPGPGDARHPARGRPDRRDLHRHLLV